MRKVYLYTLLFLLVFNLAAKAQVPFTGEDVLHYAFTITLNDENNNIKGQADVSIRFLNNVSSVRLNLVSTNSVGQGMKVISVTQNGKDLAFAQHNDVLIINDQPQSNTVHTYTIKYSGIPVDGLIISKNRYGQRTFFGDNWPDRARNWLPCADYPADKATVDFVVIAPDHYTIISNGLKTEEKQLPNDLKLTHWHEDVPIATKLMVIGAADFAVDEAGEVDGIPVYNYFFKQDSPTAFKYYGKAPEILDYYIHQIGPYAFKKLANVQSTTVFEAMENADAIFYNQKWYRGRYTEELMAHEIAHQWFGNAISEKTWLDLWLSEGFADYMTDCFLEHKYGRDTLKKRLAISREKVLAYDSETGRPIIDIAVKSNYRQLLNADSYDKGCFILHMLRRKLGDTLFWRGMRTYYAKYDGGNANTDDFRHVMKQVSGQQLEHFFRQWLFTPGCPQLRIACKYNADKKTVDLQITQKQNTLFEFPLEVELGGQLKTIQIKDKETTISIPVSNAPAQIIVDPNVNLLADFEMVKG